MTESIAKGGKRARGGNINFSRGRGGWSHLKTILKEEGGGGGGMCTGLGSGFYPGDKRI